VVPSRQQPEVIEMLKQFKNAGTVTRDFSKTYKAAIDVALPNAKQIVDRFHILKNLTDDILVYLKRKVGDKIKIVDPSIAPIPEKEVLNERERRKLETGLRKWEVIEEVQQLKQAGKNHTEIAKMLQITRPTVIKYLAIKEPPIDSRPCKLDSYIPRIKELLLCGYNYTEIFNRIKEDGYTGQISLYNSKMKGIRWEVKNKVHYLKRSDIKRLLYAPIEKIKDEQKRKNLLYYLEEQPELKQVLELVSDFKIVLLGKDETKLESWIEKAESYEIAEIDSFIKLIRWDMEAVKNAITYSYSNGLTEGHNNKIKVIKRQMYGRCKFDLLRLKILC
jgi:transposase